jgi:hypothetical protein
MLTGGDAGPAIVRGKSGESLLIAVVTGAEGVTRMPLKKTPLTDAQIATLKAWIDGGAAAPANDPPDDGKQGATHWAFVPPTRPDLPDIANLQSQISNPIDRFVLARLQEAKIAPSPAADRVTLIRRVSLDLIGLPPTPEEVQEFLKDTRPDAYERLVERLLASPHYGEKWGRHWLDQARYADSNGYSIDSARTIWPYRDWVINAFNRDQPFDKFTIEQIAGDMLPTATVEQKIATGFHRNTQINEEGGVDPEQFRNEAVSDRTVTTGTVWLGLTLGCCRCHDHKYDPFTQKEFYQLFAFLNNCDEPNLPIPSAAGAGAPARGPGAGRGGMGRGGRGSTTMVLAERATPRESYIHLGGDFSRKGETVTPAVPAALHPLTVSRDAESAERSAPNRLDLARWLVDPKNPLVARVTVNRIWQQYFGKGIVETENDFGAQGITPTHPELLDWLAVEFMEGGWSMKKVHRLIVTSATYRQSSANRPDLRETDPTNRLLARQNRLRLDAEMIRDSALVASGLLNRKVGGPSVYPPQPEGVTAFTQRPHPWMTSTGPDRYRRGIYIFFWRATPHPALLVFDAPDSMATCTRRLRSNTPLQALTLLNDQAYVELAQGLATRLVNEKSDDGDRLKLAVQLCLGREPDTKEFDRLKQFFDQQVKEYEGDSDAAERFAGAAAKDADPVRAAAWTAVARVLINLDEFITRE